MKPHDKVSLLSSFSELKFAHRFGSPFEIENLAHEISRRCAIFSPALSPTLAKLHNGVSRLTNFSKLKFNYRFIGAFGR